MKNKNLKIFTIIAITIGISWGMTTQHVDAAKTIVVPDQFATITQTIEARAKHMGPHNFYPQFSRRHAHLHKWKRTSSSNRFRNTKPPRNHPKGK